VGEHASSATAAVAAAYARNENDEFVRPTIIDGVDGELHSGEPIVHLNFRADRARQLTHALADADFSGFDRTGPDGQEPPRGLCVVTMTEYEAELPVEVAFPAEEARSLSQAFSEAGWHQLHVAETEKYAHVTYFFNGGREEEWPGETRILVPSPRDVPSYDHKPEMSAREVTARFCAEIGKGYSFGVINFANPDMVGHTGSIPAVIQAVETTDACLGQVVDAVTAAGGVCLITADHGNAEQLLAADGLSPHTAHTTNPVPFVITDTSAAVREGGELADLAPTALELLGIRQPEKMSGESLV
jgi:2,3-bisphosphoglycerate-independent phosphoglycerate mutase